jgi:UDP-N-acetylglucosamine:LPS N-acetylglucosamine transferase
MNITGHPIRQEFYKKPSNINRHRKKLHLNPNQFTILFGGSGGGAEQTLQIIHQLINHTSTDFQAIMVAGRNKGLKQQLEQVSYPRHITPHIYGFVDDLASLIHASDLVVAKAGPNIIFESAAASKPFIATHHIKGQEDGNLDMIRYNQIGFVEENPLQAAQLLTQIISAPQILDYTQPGLKLLHQQHQPSAANIAQAIKSLTSRY